MDNTEVAKQLQMLGLDVKFFNNLDECVKYVYESVRNSVDAPLPPNLRSYAHIKNYYMQLARQAVCNEKWAYVLDIFYFFMGATPGRVANEFYEKLAANEKKNELLKKVSNILNFSPQDNLKEQIAKYFTYKYTLHLFEVLAYYNARNPEAGKVEGVWLSLAEAIKEKKLLAAWHLSNEVIFLCGGGAAGQ